MYTLTLTSDCRKAIDWIGDRYDHGYNFKMKLWLDCEQINPDSEWESDENITWDIPENIAWEIQSLIEEDWLACIDSRSNLADEFVRFINSLV